MFSIIAASILMQGQAGLTPISLVVEGERREALVHWPAGVSPEGTPLIFAFHGHGGNELYSARRYALHMRWPEAMVIYGQGLPTAGHYDLQGLKNGWQKKIGELGDRDLKYFDALLAWANSKQKIDPRRIYAMGHSNGGGFTYLLWKARPDIFAAIAPAAAFQASVSQNSPIPVIQISGKEDQVVPFKLQDRTIRLLRSLNQCGDQGLPYGQNCQIYKGANKNDVVFYQFSGDHTYPEEAGDTIVRFFKEHHK